MPEMTTKLDLSPSNLGDYRTIQIGYTGGACDINVTLANAQQEVGYQFEHNAITRLYASLIGYSRLLLQDPEDIKSTFMQIATTEQNLEVPYSGLFDTAADDIARGEEESYFSRADLGLRCLTEPIPANPGGQLNRTGIYTHRNEHGELFLAFYPEPTQDELSINADVLAVSSLCAIDITPVAELLYQTSLGNYQRDIAAFTLRHFNET